MTLLLASAVLATALGAQGEQKRDRERDQQTRTTTASWQDERRAKTDARQFRRVAVSGEEVAENVRRLRRELRWHRSLGGALAAARASGKPLVWIQALGDLDGFL